MAEEVQGTEAAEEVVVPEVPGAEGATPEAVEEAAV